MGPGHEHEDRPLVGRPKPATWHPRLYAAELVGTAVLVTGGLSVVIFMFGNGSPALRLLPDAAVRRFITGFLFGLTGALVTVSPIGRVSGAHLNPAVTLAFTAHGKLAARDALGYVVAQLAGGLLGAVPLLIWGAQGWSVLLGATVPEPGAPAWAPLLGEAGVTFALVATIFVMGAHTPTRPFTPWSIPPLFAVLVWLEAPLSGTSANPARTFGPNVLAGQTACLWIYFVGPAAGALLAVASCRLNLLGWRWPQMARVAHFHLDDPPVSGQASRAA